MNNKDQKAKCTKHHHLVPQAAQKHHSVAVDYRIYRLFNWSSHYYEKRFRYISVLVEKTKLRQRARIFSPEVLIPIIGNLVTFKLVCDTNQFDRPAAMSILAFLVEKTLTNASSSCMYEKDSFAPLFALSQNQKPRSQNLLRSYLEEAIYFIKVYASVLTTAKNDVLMLRYIQPLRVTR